MKRFLIGALLMGASAMPALASGGLSCSAETSPVTFEVMAGVTRGLGSPTFNFRGSVDIADKSLAEDLRRIEFGENNLPQYWLDGEQLLLLAYTERDAATVYGETELEIRAKIQGEPDEGTYAGSYKLTVSDSRDGSGEPRVFTHEGEVSCFVE